MRLNVLSPSFTGYTNVFANNLKFDEHHMLLSMQLDNKGTNDLDRYINLKRMQGFVDTEQNRDLMSIFYSRINKRYHFLFFNDARLLWGEELKNISESVSTHQDLSTYKRLENIYMKTYTFLADITQRISHDISAINTNSEYYRVLEHSENSMANILSNRMSAYEFVLDGLFKKEPSHRQIAGSINSKIAKSMEKFFNFPRV